MVDALGEFEWDAFVQAVFIQITSDGLFSKLDDSPPYPHKHWLFRDSGWQRLGFLFVTCAFAFKLLGI